MLRLINIVLIACFALIPAALIPAVLIPAAAARADSGTTSTYRATTAVSFGKGQGYVPAVETTLTLRAGEKRHLRGRLEVTSDVDRVVALNAALICSAPELAGTISASSRNHEGFDADYAVRGSLPLVVDLLVRAPADGDYRCGLHGLTDSTKDDPYRLTVVTGGRTFLQVSDTDQVGAQWWENPSCDSGGAEATCRYVGPGQSPDAWVFYDDGTPVIKWPATGERFEARANVTVTTCYKLTRSCARVPESDRLQRRPGTRSVALFRLEAVQLTADGNRSCGFVAGTEREATILDDAHHYTAYLALPDVAVSTAATCGRSFLLRVYVRHVSGSPLKIDGRQGETSLTNAIMMNR